MKAKIAKWGNSVALRVPKGLAEDLGLVPGKVVDLKRDGTVLAVETAPDRRKIPVYRLEDLVAEMKRLGPESQPELVDWGPDRGAEIIEEDAYSRGEITLDDLLKERDAARRR
jgi:antitoxin MazE